MPDHFRQTGEMRSCRRYHRVGPYAIGSGMNLETPWRILREMAIQRIPRRRTRQPQVLLFRPSHQSDAAIRRSEPQEHGHGFGDPLEANAHLMIGSIARLRYCPSLSCVKIRKRGHFGRLFIAGGYLRCAIQMHHDGSHNSRRLLLPAIASKTLFFNPSIRKRLQNQADDGSAEPRSKELLHDERSPYENIRMIHIFRLREDPF